MATKDQGFSTVYFMVLKPKEKPWLAQVLNGKRPQMYLNQPLIIIPSVTTALLLTLIRLPAHGHQEMSLFKCFNKMLQIVNQRG